MQPYLELEVKDRLGIICLNAPPHNFIQNPAIFPLTELQDFIQKPEVSALLIKGKGRHFSAGADLESLKLQLEDTELLQENLKQGKEFLRVLKSCKLPVMAAISGSCFGGGMEIALHAHIRMGGENSLYAFPEINHGLMPGLGGSVLLPKLLGKARATEWILSGNIISAEESLKIGLLDYVVPTKELEIKAEAHLRSLVQDKPRYIIEAIMTSLQNALELDEKEAMERETRLFCQLAISSMGSSC